MLEFRASEGERFEMTADEWRRFAERAVVLRGAREGAGRWASTSSGTASTRRPPRATTRCAAASTYAIAKSLAAAPFADLLWMETKTADLDDAREFAEAIHAEFPDKMLAYNLSPSFNWDTTGMSDDEMRRFPEELGKLGFVFNFITYGGHQIDGLAGRGVRHRPAPGRHARARPPAAEVPPRRVALPDAADAGRRAARRRRARWPRRAAPRPPRRWARARPSTSTWSRPRCRRSCSRSGWRCGAQHYQLGRRCGVAAAAAHAPARSCSS